MMFFVKRFRFFAIFITLSLSLALTLTLMLELAAAQRPKPVVAHSASRSSTLVARASLNVLYDQTDHPDGTTFPSQEFEVSDTNYNSQGADDFVIPATELSWTIDTVEVLGTYSDDGGPTPFVNVYFYADASGLPGSTVYSATQIVPANDVAGNLTINLPEPVMLPAGTYWLSVQADMDFDPDGQWFWGTRTVQSNNPYVWQNPGDGFGNGCTTWAAGASVCNDSGSLGPDALFRLMGIVGTTRLAANKIVDQEIIGQNQVAAGQTLTYTVSIQNVSTVDAINTIMTDPIPTGTKYISGSLGTQGEPPALFNNNSITWAGTVSSTQAITFSYQVNVISTTDYLTNTAMVSHANLAQPLTPTAVSQLFGGQDYLYSNETDVAIPDNGCPSAVSVPIEVTDDFIVRHVHVGLNLDSTYRGDILATLQSPSGTLVSLITSGSDRNENFDIVLADIGTSPIDNNTDDNTGIPFYERHVSPLRSLSRFNNENALGTWKLLICDDSSQTSATLNHWSLFFFDEANEPSSVDLLLEWSSTEANPATSVAWGDYDGDGDLDLAVGNLQQPNLLYGNDNGLLTTDPIWTSDEVENTMSVAWGDYDDDGDLDLAVGNDSGKNRLYRNDNGMLTSSAIWSSDERDVTTSLVWGDYDSDGDLDLAVGNDDQPNRLYRNDNGMLTVNAIWSSKEIESTQSVAWGDYDSDGDLDLVVGNGNYTLGEPNRLYRNDDGVLTTSASWSSDEANYTRSVAWGDYDGDGDLDLAVGNGGDSHNELYRNDNGVLTTSAVWLSNEADDTTSLAWGDYDSDGDLDLAVGNGDLFADGQANRLYHNNGETLIATASWSSNETDRTYSVAWGDYDGDGDLDLAVGNGDDVENVEVLSGQPNRLYRNDRGVLADSPVWLSNEADSTASVAWGDYDSDGDLDLAVGNLNQPNKLYENENGSLTISPIWLSDEISRTHSVAWGDYDSDGDLDLAVGNDGQNLLYRNDERMLTTTPVWSSDEADTTTSVAWGDYDSDGDLDLVVGNSLTPNRLYRNDNGVLTTGAVWSSREVDDTSSVAWGDYDGDGDLDLAVGNSDFFFGRGEPNRLYRNDGGMLTTNAVWKSAEADGTYSIAWGDYDGDGDLDLAVGNGNWIDGHPNRLYRNDNGVLTTNAVWTSVEVQETTSVAWGDYDGDGDLDLAAGNSTQFFYSNHSLEMYRNDNGSLTMSAVWALGDNHDTESIAWGDYDNDGDLDLAVGSRSENRIYQNIRWSNALQPNNPAYATISRPDPTDKADFFSTPYIITGTNISITYTLFDPDGDLVDLIWPEFSPNGGGQWFHATPGSGGDGVTNLAASPNGTPHTFVWNAEADLIKSDHVVFRIRVQPNNSHSPIHWPLYDAKSLPFRVAAPQYIKVIDDRGLAISGATIHADGQPITQTLTGLTVTNQAGLINPGLLEVGTPLTVLAQKAEQPTARDAHDGWAYRVYLTNLNLDQNGEPQPFLSTETGEQRLVVRQDNPLILFNIVVSVEWDADDAYLATIEEAFHKASDYLYDVTDGQMAFGEVKIYDNSEYWSDADFQISTKNTVRPYAFIGGITSDDTAHSIRVGRFWMSDWNQPNGYRTLIHEFGHYALYLHDEYFVRTVDENGHFTGQQPAACTGLEVISSDETPTNASIMYYQYKASELADSDRWTINCRYTEQARVNDEPDWQTILRNYSDQEGQQEDDPDWLLNTPSSRGSVMAGPETFPRHLLPFPLIKVSDSVASGPARQLTVLDPDGEPFPNALVVLYTTPYSYTIAIDQGLTDLQGKLTIYGALEGDIIRVASFDGALAATETVDERESYEVTLSLTGPSQRHSGQTTSPYLNLVPSSEGDSLSLEVHGAAAGSGSLTTVVIPGDGGGSPQSTSLAYSTSESAYTGQVSFAGLGLGSGEAQISGMAGDQLLSINSDYNLFQVINARENELASEDGNMQWYIDAGSLPHNANAYAAIFPTGYVPKALPNGKQRLGSAYGIRFSGAATELTKPGLLSMHYHPEVMGNATDLAIYRWDPVTENWLLIGGEENEVDNSITAPVTHFGIYALGGSVDGDSINQIYLPIMLNQVQ